MSKRRLRKRRHIREAYKAEVRAASQRVVASFRRELDEKMFAVSRMASEALVRVRPLGLLRGAIPPGQSFKLDPGEFIGMMDPGCIHPWHEIDNAEPLLFDKEQAWKMLRASTWSCSSGSSSSSPVSPSPKSSP